jgi:hypothetical protein
MPRGWERTYPNLLTMEAVRGGEVYKFGSSFPENAPIMNTVYPFTRNVVGSMDYTPVMFSDHTYPHKTTYAHELATSIVFESGITHFADNYREYLKQPAFIKKFLQEIEVVWDESKLLFGYPGKEICVARRNGDKWFVAGLNSLDLNKKMEIPLSFLPEGNYQAEIISDGKDDRSFNHLTKNVSNMETVEIDLLPFGGFTIVIK